MDLESALLLLNNIISPDSAQESQDKSRPVLTHVEDAFSFSSTSYLYCTGILSTQTTLPCKTNKLLLNHTHNGWSLTNNEFFDVFCTLRSVPTLEVTLFFSGGFGSVWSRVCGSGWVGSVVSVCGVSEVSESGDMVGKIKIWIWRSSGREIYL